MSADLPDPPTPAVTYRPDDADVVVDSASGLRTALREATPADVVYVADGATVDLSGATDLPVPSGVGLVGGRDLAAGRPGALLTVGRDDTAGTLFLARGNDVRVAGLRLVGPRPERYEVAAPNSHDRTALHLLGTGGEVVNCELAGWPHAAVAVGSRSHAPRARVASCHVHHNALEGLGYGVEVFDGHAVVEDCVFDHNRHAVDGFGHRGCGYEARRNYVGPHTYSHVFDMHRLDENVDGADPVAGRLVDVHHNTVAAVADVDGTPQEAIAVRGVPTERVRVWRNRFAHEGPPEAAPGGHGDAYRQGNVPGWRRFDARSNVYAGARDADAGCPWA